MPKPILVTGATGNQGGAVLEALIKQNNPDFLILALTRNATSPAAKRIATKSKSVHVLQGNVDSPDQIFTDAQKLIGAPVWGVFMVQSVITGGVTGPQEEAQGKAFISSCISHDINFLVYSSVDRGGPLKSPQDPTPVDVFASKHRIEQHLFKMTASTDTNYLVLRPTGLIEPLLRNDMVGKIVRTSWKIYMKPEKTLQWVSCKDVGYFAALAFTSPSQFAGQSLSLAGWEGTFDQANTIYKNVTGRDFGLTFGLLTRFICGVLYKDLAVSYEWYNGKGFGADVGGLREMYPGLMGFEDCVKESVGGGR